MKLIRPGDRIRSPSGKLRTVIDVSRCKGRTCVTVPILHCSWTHRTYTVLDNQQLLAYQRTPHRLAFRRYRHGRMVLKDCEGAERAGTCCDVVGQFT